MVSRVGVSEDFRKQVLGYGLTTAEILYRMPDHPSLLQTYVWQNYDLFPKILGNPNPRDHANLHCWSAFSEVAADREPPGGDALT